jgi:hypothetical protein
VTWDDHEVENDYAGDTPNPIYPTEEFLRHDTPVIGGDDARLVTRDIVFRGQLLRAGDRVVPMLPEALSNDLCSLQAGTDRLALSLLMVVDREETRITDSAGTVVREIKLETAEGTRSFTWDGLRNDGTQAESDSYDIEAVATVRGQTGSLEVLMAGRVSSVSLDASGTNLSLNTATLGSISMADVRRVQ